MLVCRPIFSRVGQFLRCSVVMAGKEMEKCSHLKVDFCARMILICG